MYDKAVFLVLAAVASAATWTPEFQMKVKSVGEVVPSADGRRVAYTQTRALMEAEKSESVTEIWLYSAGERFRLATGAEPRFSPDGAFVFFTSERDGKPAIFRIAVDGGEAERITDLKVPAASYELSPNGKWIAFAGREPDPEEERAKKEKRDFRVIDESPRNAQLYVIAVEADSSGKRLARQLATGPYNVSGIQWAPDSRRIAFETRPTPDANDGRRSDILEVDVESGAVKPIAATGAAEAQPRYSRDGRYVAFVKTAEPAGVLNGARIVLYSRADGKMRELPATYDESPNLVDWAADSRGIFFLEARGTKSSVYLMPVDGPARAFYQPARGTLGFAARTNSTGTYLGFSRQSSDEPVEGFILPVAGGEPVRVSAANTALEMPPLGETSLVRWKSKDGRDIEGLLTLPPGYAKGTRVPLVLNIHGGPAGAFNESFIGASGLYPIATFAARGWAVLRPNPRGSSAYGRAFRAANLNDWGGGDYQDIMAGVDYVIAQGIADPNRMVVMGWSYGGYMTNWVVTQTNRFKAAAAGAGLSNMASMWGTNDIPSTLDDYFSGPWYEQPERYAKLSPLYHVKNAVTPMMILHGEADIRVPTSQGYEMYNAMKRKGVEAKMVVYPRTPHGPREPKFVLDIMQRHVEWIEKHI